MAENLNPEEGIALPMVYTGASDNPILFANHFALGIQSEEFILTVGQLTLPLLAGAPEEQLEQARSLSNVPIRVLARYAFGRARAAEMRDLLSRQIDLYDERAEKAKEAK